MTTDEFNEKFAKTVSIVWTTFIVILVFNGIIYGAFSFGELVGKRDTGLPHTSQGWRIKVPLFSATATAR